MRKCGGSRSHGVIGGGNGFGRESGISALKQWSKGTVEGSYAGLQQQMRSALDPLHLLTFLRIVC